MRLGTCAAGPLPQTQLPRPSSTPNIARRAPRNSNEPAIPSQRPGNQRQRHADQHRDGALAGDYTDKINQALRAGLQFTKEADKALASLHPPLRQAPAIAHPTHGIQFPSELPNSNAPVPGVEQVSEAAAGDDGPPLGPYPYGKDLTEQPGPYYKGPPTQSPAPDGSSLPRTGDGARGWSRGATDNSSNAQHDSVQRPCPTEQTPSRHVPVAQSLIAGSFTLVCLIACGFPLRCNNPQSTATPHHPEREPKHQRCCVL